VQGLQRTQASFDSQLKTHHSTANMHLDAYGLPVEHSLVHGAKRAVAKDLTNRECRFIHPKMAGQSVQE
jgi:hypothetical protein